MTIRHVDCDDFRKKRAGYWHPPPCSRRTHRRPSASVCESPCTATCWQHWFTGWSLEDEFSRDNLMALLENAPYLADWIDRTSENALAFFGSSSTGLSSIAEPKQP